MARRYRGARPHALLIALLVAQVFAAIPPSRAATPIVGPLSTSGNQILDANGIPVILRGVTINRMKAIPEIEWAPQLNDASFDAMRSWGINAVRLALGQQLWLETECEYSPKYASYVDTVVERITSRGMVAILDLHYNTRKRCMPARMWRMADQGSLDFWRAVSSRYKTNPLVAFDLYNEPHDITWQQWRYGGMLIDGGVTWKAAGMQQLYNAVRSTGAENLVYVSGNGWATKAPPDEYLIAGYNIVYSTHRYTCVHEPPPKCTTPNPYDPAPPGQRLSRWESFLLRNPVQINEFGWPKPSTNGATFYRNVITWAESQGVGWIAHTWDDLGDDPRFALLKDWVTFDPTPIGTVVRDGTVLNR
jgi:hypothetical protein